MPSARVSLRGIVSGLFMIGWIIYGAAAPAQGQAPIPNDKGAYTQAQYNKALYEFLKQDVEAYRQHTKDQGELRDKGATFIDDFYRNITRQPRAKRLAIIVPIGAQIATDRPGYRSPTDGSPAANRRPATARSWDPFLLAVVGAAHSMAGLSGEGWTGGANAYIDESNYGPRQRMLAHCWYLQYYQVAEPSADLYIPALLNWLKVEKDVAAHRRMIWENINPVMLKIDAADRQKLQDEYAMLPGADPWLSEMIAGANAFRLAWAARGQGYASKVTQPGWKGFEEELSIAAEHFKKAIKIDPNLPEGPTSMINVARSGGNEHPPRFWFDQAMKAQMDYHPAFSGLRTSLLPEWGGSHAALYQFGVECFKTGRYDTGTPFELFICLKAVEEEVGPEARLWGRPGVYPMVREMLRAYEASGSLTDTDRYQRLAMLAAVAMRIGDYAEARKALDALGKIGKDETLFNDTFNSLHVEPFWAVARIHAATGSAKDVMAKLNPLLDNMADCEGADIDQAEKLLREARAKSKEPDAKEYLDSVAASLPLQRKLLGDKWVDVSFDKKLWFKSGTCKMDLHGDYAVLERPAPPLGQPFRNERIVLNARLHVPFEVEVDLGRAEPVKRNVLGGVATGVVNNSQTGRFFFAGPGGRGIGFSWGGERPMYQLIPVPEVARMRVASWQGAFQFSVADDNFFRFEEPRANPEGIVALGLTKEIPSMPTVKFSRLRIRRLDYGPPPDESDHEASIDYYGRILLVDSDNVAAHYWRGMAYHGLGKFDEAAKDLDYVVKHGQHPEKVRSFLDSLRKK